MKAYTDEVDQREVVLDLDIRCVEAHFPLLGAFPQVTPCTVLPPAVTLAT